MDSPPQPTQTAFCRTTPDVRGEGPAPRWGHSVLAHNGLLYIVGGTQEYLGAYAEVFVLDPDAALNAATDRVAAARAWPIRTSTADLAAEQEVWPDGWPVGSFDAVHSYCVLEHIPYAGQERLLPRLARALAPGGRMVLTFEYGQEAPGEAPWRDAERLQRMIELLADAGLQLAEPQAFHDAGQREVLDKRHPEARFAFGMLVLEKPGAVS